MTTIEDVRRVWEPAVRAHAKSVIDAMLRRVLPWNAWEFWMFNVGLGLLASVKDGQPCTHGRYWCEACQWRNGRSYP